MLWQVPSQPSPLQVVSLGSQLPPSAGKQSPTSAPSSFTQCGRVTGTTIKFPAVGTHSLVALAVAVVIARRAAGPFDALPPVRAVAVIEALAAQTILAIWVVTMRIQFERKMVCMTCCRYSSERDP